MLNLPNYQLHEKIYESLNTSIYRAKRKQDTLPVILKVLKQDYPSSAELSRYQQEYKIINDLKLDGVIKVYAIEKYQNTLFLVLEDIGAKSLKQLLLNSPVTINEFIPLAIQIADSLANLHTENLIHKDINPSNIVINPLTKQIKIIDFGIEAKDKYRGWNQLYLSTSNIMKEIPEYIQDSGNPMPPNDHLSKVIFFSQQILNG